VTEFDPVRAQRDIVTGIDDVHKLVLARARHDEAALAEAEAQHNASVKMAAFMRGLLDEARAKLQALETETGK